MQSDIRGTKALRGELVLPPDKSIAHRAAMFALIADGVSEIGNYSPAADPQTTLDVITALGARVEKDGDTVRIHGCGRDRLRVPDAPVDCGNSGTTMRFMAGLLSGAGIPCTMIGDESLSRRPMKRVVDPLERMGARIEARDGTFPPLQLHANEGLKGIDFTLPMPSAQLKSCLLLAGLFCDEEVTVRERLPSRNHTEILLQLPVSDGPDGTRIIRSSRHHTIPLQNYVLPGDFSSAAFWLVAGSIMHEGEILVRNVGLNPTRDGALGILQRMGANIEEVDRRQAGAEVVADLRVRPAKLQATHLTEAEVAVAIDEIPVLTLAMAFAEGVSKVRGAAELRVKECDRIRAMGDILDSMQIPFVEYEDGLEITGRPEHRFGDIHIETHHDHRIAMSAGVASVRCDGTVRINGAEHAAITYSRFWEDLAMLGS